MVFFNFTGFEDVPAGLGNYRWGLGSVAGKQNVIGFQTINAVSLLFTSFSVNTSVRPTAVVLGLAHEIVVPDLGTGEGDSDISDAAQICLYSSKTCVHQLRRP